MPLTHLYVSATHVRDLTPLVGMPLEFLSLGDSQVTDLAPLKGMRLWGLHIYETKVTDLSPLRGMPLKELKCYGTYVQRPDVLARNLEVLRSLKTLEKINDKPAADFLRELATRKQSGR